MDQLSNLPLPIKVLLATLSGGCLIGAAYMVDPRAMWIVLIGLFIVAAIFGLYLFILFLMRRRHAESMGGSIQQHSSIAPRGISDPARRAKLDDLRQNFQKGVELFRRAGKDLYSLPWYMVVGEPGSGKTEAIRHSNVGFPPGLQDELQGAGGTINMHWWFTNKAVILDTAGRLLFEEVPPGSTSEWLEFLKLLRKSRPNCPINGLILVIPADSLIKDTADEIARKADRIAKQLNTIKDNLNVRFPVFVFITKGDLINGFREFFNDMNDPQLQHQMLGWSNPAPLDEKFKPELVDDYFSSVIGRIRRRRLGLLQDPTPQDGGESRRLDEVDALFSLPASISLLAPRLKRYLELIFGENEWSSKPLFLRGIYFASAMREGSALDLELAEAIGVPVDSLPEGKNWERERAYFLRDVFLEKIFQESGLVTNAGNTKRMLRRRQALLFGAGFLGLFLLLGFSWIGARSLRDSVGRERDFWLAANEGWKDGTWRPILEPTYDGGAVFVSNGAQPIKVGTEQIKLSEFHHALAKLAQSDIRVPWVFKPMESVVAGANPSRRRAQRIMFESSVVLPLVQAARAKASQAGDKWTPSSSEALAFLIRLEGMIQNRDALGAEDLSAAGFLKPLHGFLFDDQSKPDPDLVETFDWVYFKGGDGKGHYPPRYLSAGLTLADNQPVAKGLNIFIAKAQDAQKAQTLGFETIKRVRGELRALRQAEDELARLAAASGANAGFATAGESALAAVQRQKALVDGAVADAVQKGVFEPKKVLLTASYKTLIEETRQRTETAFKLIQTELERYPTISTTTEKGSPYTLPAEIRRNLIKVQQEMRSKVEGTFTSEELGEMQGLDAAFLDASGGDPLYAARTALYQEAAATLRDPRPGLDSIVGTLDRALGTVHQSVLTVREKTTRYKGAYASEFTLVTTRTLELAETTRTQALLGRYFDEVDGRIARQAAFPLLAPTAGVPMTLPGLRDTNALLQLAQSDLGAIRAGAAATTYAARADQLERRIQRLRGLSDALLAEENRPAMVTITLLKNADQRLRLMKQLGTDDFINKFAGTYWRNIRFGAPGADKHRAEATVNTELGRVPVSEGAIRVDFFLPENEEQPARTFNLTAPWAPLRLLHQPYARRLPGGKEWEVLLTLKDSAGQDRHIFLLLQFEKPLPDIDDWPTASRLGL